MGLITLLNYSFDGSIPTIPTDPGTLNTGTVAQVGGKLQYSVTSGDNTDWYPPSSVLMRGKLAYFSIPEMKQYRVIYAESEVTSFIRNTPNSHANFMLWQDERNTAWIYTHASPTGTINAFRMVNGGWEGWGGPSVTHPVRVRMIWDRGADTVAYQYWTGAAWATIYTTQSFPSIEFTRVAWYLKSWEGGTCSATWDYILVQGEDLIKFWPGTEPSPEEPVKASVEEVIRLPQTTQGPTGRGVRLPGAAGSDIEDPSFGTQAAPKAAAEELIRIDQRALYSIPTGDPQKNPSFDQTVMSVEEELRLAQASITQGPNEGPTNTEQGKFLPPRMAVEEEVYQEIIDAVDFSPYTTDGDGRAHLGDTRVNHIFLYDSSSTIFRDDFNDASLAMASDIPLAGETITESGGTLNFAIDAAVDAAWDAGDRYAPIVYRPLTALSSGATKHIIETSVVASATAAGYARAGIAIYVDDTHWLHYNVRKHLDNTYGDEFVTYTTFRDGSGSTTTDGTNLGAAVYPMLLRVTYTPGTETALCQHSTNGGSTWVTDFNGATYITTGPCTTFALFLLTDSSAAAPSSASFDYVLYTAGEQWAAPSPGSGFYGAGRDGKHYYNGNECGPALNGTSFGTLAGGYNHKTWMTDVEPSAISAGVTKVVMALVADDHVKFNSTSPLTGWETKGLWTRHRWCLIGDFDIQVEYENRSVSGGSDGNTPVLLAYVDDTDGVYMRRHHDGSYDSDIITNNSWGSYVNSGVKAWSAGKLRIVRVGQAISCYYWNAGWVALRTSTDRGAVMAKPMRVEVQVGGTGSLTVNRVDVFGFVINSGTPVNTAGWAREAAGATRGTQAAFPTKALIASTMEGIDIIDTATSKLWMRFSRATNNALWSTTIEPRRIVMRNGMMLVSYGIGAGGTICIDFTTDDIRIHDLQSVAWTGARLRAYNGVYWGPVGASGRDCGPVGIIASRNLAGGYSGDSDNWRIPSATVRFTDIYEDGGYLYKVHATQAGLGVHKWQRWYNDGAVGSNWWSPIYFSSAVTTDMWWCWVDPSDGTLYYMDSDVLGGAVGNIYIVPKATWTATASGGTFAASATKTRPSNRWWTSFRGFQGSTECFIKGGYIYHAADEGIWRIDSALAGSWELYIGSTSGSAVLPILPVDLLGVSGAQFCKDDSATANLLLLECVLRNGRYQLYVINFDSGAVFARGSLRKGRNCSYLAGNVV